MKISGKKPTREERKILEKNNIDTYSWLIKSHTTKEIKLIHRETGEIKTITL